MDRQENRCHLQEKGCGGCPLLSIPYEEQIHMKQKEMKKLMGNFGKVRPVGIILIVVGVACGILSIIGGARLFKNQKMLTF